MIGIVAGFILWSGLVSAKDSVVVPVSALPSRHARNGAEASPRQKRNEPEEKPLPGSLASYCTMKPGITDPNCVQPSPRLSPI